MAQKTIVFPTGQTMTIEESSTAAEIRKTVAEWDQIRTVWDALQDLHEFYFALDGVKVTENFTDYVFDRMSVTADGAGYLLSVSTHQKSELELLRERMAAVESSQTDQDDAINYLLMGGESEPVEESSTEPVEEEPAESEVE